MPQKRPRTKTGRPRARKGVKLKPTELGPGQLRIDDPPAELQALARQVEEDGGAVLALLVPERAVAYQILALNIEKAHNLREKSLEVARMVRDLATTDAGRRESDLTLELEEPALVTLGFAYEQRGRLSGGAYAPALRKVDRFLDVKIPDAVPERERRAGLVLELDDAVTEAIEKLKAKGLTSPYLKAFVVARVNPL